MSTSVVRHLPGDRWAPHEQIRQRRLLQVPSARKDPVSFVTCMVSRVFFMLFRTLLPLCVEAFVPSTCMLGRCCVLVPSFTKALHLSE